MALGVHIVSNVRQVIRVVAIGMVGVVACEAIALGTRAFLSDGLWVVFATLLPLQLGYGVVRGVRLRHRFEATDGLTAEQRRRVLSAIRSRSRINDVLIREAAIRRLLWAYKRQGEQRAAALVLTASVVVLAVLAAVLSSIWFAIGAACLLIIGCWMFWITAHRTARLRELGRSIAPEGCHGV